MEAVIVFFASLIGMVLILLVSSWENRRGKRIGGALRRHADHAVLRGAALIRVHLPEAGKNVARSGAERLLAVIGSAILDFVRRIETRLSLVVRTGLKRDRRTEKQFSSAQRDGVR